MRKDLYKKRVDARICVTCRTPLCCETTKRKCRKCLCADNKYRKDSRNQRIVDTERKYRQKVWYKRCVWKSTRKDRIKNRTSDDPMVKPIRLQTLRVLQRNKCFYCEEEMQVINRKKSNGLTIERLDNRLPHTTKNVVLCCSRCNCKRLSDKHEIDITKAVDLILDRFESSSLYTKFLELLTRNESLPNIPLEETDTNTLVA